METKKNLAAEKKISGKCNCAQAVLCTYYDKAKINLDMAMQLGNSFAVGMGNMEGTCGAIVGAGMILGLCCHNKTEAMQKMRQIMIKFQQRNTTTQCKLLKGIETKKVLRECPECVADAAEFLEEVI